MAQEVGAAGGAEVVVGADVAVGAATLGPICPPVEEVPPCFNLGDV